MKQQSFTHRFIFPVIPVFILLLISFIGYFGSRMISIDLLHQAMAVVFGTTYFISVAFGTLYIYTKAYIRGASMAERIFASALCPFIWMTKEVMRISESHPLHEALYWYLNPLSIWLVSFMIMEMGIATLIARRLLRKGGADIRVVTAAPVGVIIGSLTFVISAYAWGRGENLYVIFLEGYRMLFGAGI